MKGPYVPMDTIINIYIPIKIFISETIWATGYRTNNRDFPGFSWRGYFIG